MAWLRGRLGVGLLAIAPVVAGGVFVWQDGRRLDGELAQARQEIARKALAPARVRLAALFAQRPGWRAGEVAFWHGYCEWGAGRRNEALAAFAWIPPGTELDRRAAFYDAEYALDQGRLRAAEVRLEAVLAQGGSHRNDTRAWLGRVYRMEGRTDDVRSLLRESLPEASDPVKVLYDLWLLDRGTVPPDSLKAALDIAQRHSPEDDRVWLGQARVAIQLGRFDEAHALLLRCRKKQADAPVWRAWLEWARGTDQPEEALAALRAIGTGRLEPGEILAWRVWLFHSLGNTAREREALEAWLKIEPRNPEALEQLGDLLQQANSERAGLLRAEKAEVDRALDRYRQRFRAGERFASADDRAAMGTLAESIGRTFDARAWFALALQAEPAHSDARAGIRQLDEQAAYRQRTMAELKDPWAGFAGSRPVAPGRQERPTAGVPTFSDDAKRSELAFVFDNGESLIRQTPDALAGGVGLLDYDDDGWLDVYLVQGGHFPPDDDHASPGDRLFRNQGDGSFVDVSKQAGLRDIPAGYGHGVAVGDYDNDGHPDLFLTRWRSYRLLHNRGDGHFDDVTDQAGLGGDRDWPTSAAWADLDGDGDLDLYVCHYLVWDPQNPKLCRSATTQKYIHCNPRDCAALPDHLFRNDDGHFVDVTAEAGIVDQDGRGLGVVAADFDGDGRLDLFVANDETANFLWHNLGGMRFEEVGHAAGVAANAEGGYQAGMGVACGDLDNDGRLDVAVTNFYGESTSFFQNLGDGIFADRAAAINLAAPSRYLLGFGITLSDLNNDGWLDLMTANGHLDDLGETPYRMPAQILVGDGHGGLREATSSAGPALQARHLGRALAAGDLDNDGRIDAVIVSLNEPITYLHNTTRQAGHFVTFRLEGRKSNRDAVGAQVTIESAGRRQTAQRIGGGSYQAAGDPRIHFGLGAATRVQNVEVHWPSGHVGRYRDLAAGQGYLLQERDDTAKPLPGFSAPK